MVNQSYEADFDPSGRLVTTSYDGLVRLYDRDFRLRLKRQAPGGKQTPTTTKPPSTPDFPVALVP